jgi:hypothetical protein
MRKPRRYVKLTGSERTYLEKIANTGVQKIKAAKRARMLLLLDASEGRLPDKEESIANTVGVSRQTIQAVKKEYFTKKRLEEVLSRAKRSTPPVPAKVTGEVEARIIALACSASPEGTSRWSLRLLAEKIVELHYIGEISHMTVSRLLKKHNLNHI